MLLVKQLLEYEDEPQIKCTLAFSGNRKKVDLTTGTYIEFKIERKMSQLKNNVVIDHA